MKRRNKAQLALDLDGGEQLVQVGATSCGCCGRALTDARSRATGFGKVCAAGNGIPWRLDVRQFRRAQREQDQQIRELRA